MNSLFENLTEYLLGQSVHIVWLFLLVGVVCLALRNKSAHLRYLLWLLIIVKCLVPSLVTISLAILPEKAEPVVEQVVHEEAAELAPEVFIDAVTEYVPMVESPVDTRPAFIQYITALSKMELLAFGWMVGAGLFLVIVAVRAMRTNTILTANRRALPELLQAEVNELLGGQSGAGPKCYCMDGIAQPFVWGLVRGSIYLPADFMASTDGEHRRQILMHEMAHITRRDPVVNFFQIIAQVVFFFHPLVWVANRLIRAEREKCCDEAAIARLDASPKDYGKAIVNTLVNEYESTMPTPSMAIAGPIKNIENRIKTIMQPGRKFYKRPTVIALLMILLIAAVTVPVGFALSNRPAKDPAVEVGGGVVRGNKLEFRILPESVESSRAPSPLRVEDEMKYRKDLRENGVNAGRKRGDKYIWLELGKYAPARSNLFVIEKIGEKSYVLTANLKNKMMLADGTWGLQKIYSGKDYMGRPSVKFEFDTKGSELFYKLTSGNINTRLGMIIDGNIYSAPQINSAVRGEASIVGTFSEAEVKDIVGMLSKGMPPVVPRAEGQQPGFQPTIEITINDNIAVGKNSIIDFDTGRLYSRPENWREMSADDGLRWIEKTGLDASGATRSTIRGLDCNGMIFSQRPNSRWYNIRADWLAATNLWKVGKPGIPAYMTAQGQLPATYMFKTREGGIGVLQITGFNDEPRGVNIQYKMIEKPPVGKPVAEVEMEDMPEDMKRVLLKRIDLDNVKNVKFRPAGKKVLKSKTEESAVEVPLNNLSEDTLILEVLGRKIYLKDINPSEVQQEKYQSDKTQEQFNKWLKQRQESGIRSVVFGTLFREYIKSEGIEATDADIKEYHQGMDRAMAGRRLELKEARDKLAKELDGPEIDHDRKLEIESQIKNYDKWLERQGQRELNEISNGIAKKFIGSWKANKSLFEKYGGRVVFQQGGPEPLDAYREFLKQQEVAGRFEIMNEQAADLFWNYFTNDDMHTFFSDESKAVKSMNTPWWLMNRVDDSAKQ